MPSDTHSKTAYSRLLPTCNNSDPSLRTPSSSTSSSHSPSASRTASPVPLPHDDHLQDHYAYSTQLHRREPESIVDFSQSHGPIPLINDLKHAAQRFTSYDPPTSSTSSSSHGGNSHGGGGGGQPSVAYPAYPPHHHAAPSSSTSYSHHPFAHTTSPLTPSAHFSTLSIPQTLSSLSTSSSTGLDAQKVPAIRELSGPNEFEIDAKEPVWKKFLSKFYEDPLILLLLASACVSAVVGNYDDAASILVAVFIVISGASCPFYLIRRAPADTFLFYSRLHPRTTVREVARSAQQARPALLPPHPVRLLSSLPAIVLC